MHAGVGDSGAWWFSVVEAWWRDAGEQTAQEPQRGCQRLTLCTHPLPLRVHAQIDLATGDEIYKDGISGRWRRVKQQRTHQVKEVNGGVFVILSKGGPPLASDAYAFNAQLGNCVKHAGF